ncbi:RING finger and transmembrane domain-containing protein 2-like [Hordeum vulgare]|uniref:RING-type domain-containing protein n=1 Tax=Hordeum vulgare subsp. vulgare TaxID=112509 RepID=A0A8I6X421_HORVV|nr:RING finger and transmembrane domain-containing protein 2-like [Hordeum vulgare subsp. vulgare]KAE8806348.1 RING finger and transmembrane domain-containing protein 2-like [Hordeum vulgare]
METPSGGSADRRGTVSGASAGAAASGLSRYGLNFSASSLLQAPLAALLEYSGIVPSGPGPHTLQQAVPSSSSPSEADGLLSAAAAGDGEVSIRIQGGPGDPDASATATGASPQDSIEVAAASNFDPASVAGRGGGADAEASGGGSGGATGNGVGDRAYQRYDVHHVARWIEQILPFSLLLLVVFIRQHLQGFFVTIWIAAVMFKSNDILKKQTALKGERKVAMLVGITIIFMVHVFGFYWWYRNDDLFRPLFMVPPKDIPPFWHVIFIIMVNDTMVRQAAMTVKCMLLMYYKNSRGRNYRRQGQMLTLVEYLLLLYRALLPTPVWYRFFLNKEYGSLFSSLTTGLYLTFKLTSVVEKVQSFLSAVKALSRKDVHYGSYATAEQAIAAGDMCAICQEKMYVPVLLRCKHIFCEDCVSEWFERERTCPLCRALVKPADIRSFGDGSTSLFFQLF